jgi:hypothetical protein
VVHKFQRWALKMSVFSYRTEHVMGGLNYRTDVMTRWGVGWIAGSEHIAQGKMASLFHYLIVRSLPFVYRNVLV